MIAALDFASRFSAFCVIDDAGIVLHQGDSWNCSESEFLLSVARLFDSRKQPDVLAFEDLPHGLPFRGDVKKTCRMQGRIIELMTQFGQQDKILFVPPALWQRSYDGRIWKQKPDVVVPVAKELFDYDPPIDFSELHHKERQEAKKVNTDYSAAYLIARWMLRYWQDNGTFDAPTTSRYQ